jgi:hypothetical protein
LRISLKHGPQNLRIGDGEARDDLGGYYDDEAARGWLIVPKGLDEVAAARAVRAMTS